MSELQISRRKLLKASAAGAMAASTMRCRRNGCFHDFGSEPLDG